MKHFIPIFVLLLRLDWFQSMPIDGHDYREIIKLSLLFYEAQRSGPLPEDSRIPWRGDSALLDHGRKGEDLTGGYYDGKHIYFTSQIFII